MDQPPTEGRHETAADTTPDLKPPNEVADFGAEVSPEERQKREEDLTTHDTGF
jgi:hypothetical protein